MRNIQEQVKKAFCYQKLFWPFTVWINWSSDLKNFANSWPSASNFKSFSRSLEQKVRTILVWKYRFLTLLIQFWNLFTPMWTLQGSPQRVFSCLCTTLDMTREDCYVSLDFFRRSHGCFRWSTFPIYKSHKNMKGQWPPSYITHCPSSFNIWISSQAFIIINNSNWWLLFLNYPPK